MEKSDEHNQGILTGMKGIESKQKAKAFVFQHQTPELLTLGFYIPFIPFIPVNRFYVYQSLTSI